MLTWRDRAAPIIRQAVFDVVGATPPPYSDEDKREIRRLCRKRYPFYERKYWPYKIWLDEIARQLGEKVEEPKPVQLDPRQVAMFED